MLKNEIRKWQKIGIPLILMGDLNGISNSICNTQTSNNAQLADWWNQVNIKKQFSIPSIDITFVKKGMQVPIPTFHKPIKIGNTHTYEKCPYDYIITNQLVTTVEESCYNM